MSEKKTEKIRGENRLTAERIKELGLRDQTIDTVLLIAFRLLFLLIYLIIIAFFLYGLFTLSGRIMAGCVIAILINTALAVGVEKLGWYLIELRKEIGGVWDVAMMRIKIACLFIVAAILINAAEFF